MSQFCWNNIYRALLTPPFPRMHLWCILGWWLMPHVYWYSILEKYLSYHYLKDWKLEQLALRKAMEAALREASLWVVGPGRRTCHHVFSKTNGSFQLHWVRSIALIQLSTLSSGNISLRGSSEFTKYRNAIMVIYQEQQMKLPPTPWQGFVCI